MSIHDAPRFIVDRVEVLMSRQGTRLEARHGRADTGAQGTRYWIVYPDLNEKQVSRSEGEREVSEIGQSGLFE